MTEPGTAKVRPLPVLLVAGVLAATVGAALVDARTSDLARASAQTGRGSLTASVGLILVVCGAVVLNARPRHLVGVVLVAFGLLWAADGLFESWAAYGIQSEPAEPGTAFAFWFVDRFGSLLLVALPALLVLYPQGRLMAGPWRVPSALAVAMAFTLPVMILVSPEAALDGDQAGEGRSRPGTFSPLELPLPDELAVALLQVSRVLTLFSVVLAVAVVFARQRSATGVERVQLRWLLWAALVCLVSALALFLLSSGTLSLLLLVAALATTGASVAIGVVKPDLADVDALIAGTVVYAGVAAVVVAVDLALLGALGGWLGDDLGDREVVVLVLLVAVAVYGPVRTGIAALVRRWLVGRRGDRYEVVSGLAARLEESGDLADQLPAMATAVAQAFKLSFVRVEVYERDGGSVTAIHGSEPASTRVLPIAYRGEDVGRLVLPGRGVRALLSRRDQELLLDVVRQAAITVRAGRLARDLQESREQLVLAREDDRRRIRRDLHDGLGPVLGGVALRLDAAGNAVESDPQAARTLIRQSREDVAQALADVRRLVHDLRPPALDDLGLLAAVEQQADRARSAPLEVEVVADGVRHLPAAVEVAAYRIVSEALTNVVRHAGASSCRVSLSGADGALAVEVADDGRGIDDDVPAGVGLRSLRERVEELGGRYEVHCPPTGGTVVRAWLPAGEDTR